MQRYIRRHVGEYMGVCRDTQENMQKTCREAHEGVMWSQTQRACRGTQGCKQKACRQHVRGSCKVKLRGHVGAHREACRETCRQHKRHIGRHVGNTIHRGHVWGHIGACNVPCRRDVGGTLSRTQDNMQACRAPYQLFIQVVGLVCLTYVALNPFSWKNNGNQGQTMIDI